MQVAHVDKSCAIADAMTIIAARGYPRLPLEAAAERSRPRSQPGKGDAMSATTAELSRLVGLSPRRRRLLTYVRTTLISVCCPHLNARTLVRSRYGMRACSSSTFRISRQRWRSKIPSIGRTATVTPHLTGRVGIRIESLKSRRPVSVARGHPSNDARGILLAFPLLQPTSVMIK